MTLLGTCIHHNQHCGPFPQFKLSLAPKLTPSPQHATHVLFCQGWLCSLQMGSPGLACPLLFGKQWLPVFHWRLGKGGNVPAAMSTPSRVLESRLQLSCVTLRNPLHLSHHQCLIRERGVIKTQRCGEN